MDQESDEEPQETALEALRRWTQEHGTALKGLQVAHQAHQAPPPSTVPPCGMEAPACNLDEDDEDGIQPLATLEFERISDEDAADATSPMDNTTSMGGLASPGLHMATSSEVDLAYQRAKKESEATPHVLEAVDLDGWTLEKSQLQLVEETEEDIKELKILLSCCQHENNRQRLRQAISEFQVQLRTRRTWGWFPLERFQWRGSKDLSERPQIEPTDVGSISGKNRDDLARSGFRKSAFRCKVPEELLPHLAPLVLDVLGAPVQGLPGTGSKDQPGPSWVLRDTTVVRYQPDESQVPHVDTSDVTMLLYLSDSGGHTCFPNLGCSIQPREGRVLVFCSTKPTQRRFGGFAGSAYGEPLDATMHYGSLMQDSSHNEKLIVQLLFAAEDANLSLRSWREALHGVKLRDAEKTQNLQAQAMCSSPRAQRRPSLALDQTQRCASGCRAWALNLAVPGATKVCIHCWQRRLEQQKP
eukprot:s359_g30.t1